jgi:hypothetical protein
MFGYLLLLFQLFLGGHFHMALDGHPSHRNMGPLSHVRDDLVGTKEGSEIVSLPEWVWHYGHMVFIGDIMRFFKMSENERRDEYLRSGATMYREGAASLITIALASAFSIFLVKVVYDSQGGGDETVCPEYQQLYDYACGETILAVFVIFVCWFSCVRGITSSRPMWAFFIFCGVADLAWNIWGATIVLAANKNLCSMSTPNLTATVSGTVFVSMWVTFILLFACLRHCMTSRSASVEMRSEVLSRYERKFQEMRMRRSERSSRRSGRSNRSWPGRSPLGQRTIKAESEGGGEDAKYQDEDEVVSSGKKVATPATEVQTRGPSNTLSKRASTAGASAKAIAMT